MLAITVDPESSTPPFEQIRMRVRDAVRSGDLAAGTKLPTVRALAADLGVAVNTVAKAYRALESDAVIETRGRNGTFVSATGDPTEQQAQLAATAFADRMSQLGVDEASALAYARAALRADR
ncbi:GntR family transcriptional regulator [Agromyces mangrovi Wang et al. 2018]|uniref:GntR family transcriptional regulator n=1 Tax=Agromyces mangrovi TaxID=1858653 RepID=UPI0025729D7D|nr:GntR family transcriptional regulator [Agromyces mangrovi]BDZ64865.1 GntR family transcriptional regulator [Agromyces mangrovi]